MSSNDLFSPQATVDLVAQLRAVNERLILSNINEQTFADLAEKQRMQLSALLEGLHEGIVIANQKWRIVMLNAAARTIMALPGDGPIESRTLEVLDLRRLDMTPLAVEEQPLVRAMRGETVVDTELALVTARGDVRRILTSCSSIAEAEEGALAIMVLQDITQRRLLEARVVQAERLSAVGALASGFAHEINNPLAYAVGNLELALEELRSAGLEAANGRSHAIEEMLIAAQHGVGRVSTIVRELRTLSLPPGETTATVELQPLLEAAAHMALLHAGRPIRLVEDYRPAPLVQAAGSRLGQVLVNLLQNAVEALPHGAAHDEIRVSTGTGTDGNAVVEIVDNGKGIPLEILPRIFEPFFTTKAIGAGLGLGLFTCRNVVLAMGGELTVQSVPGAGTHVRLSLPRHGLAEPTPHERTASAAPPRAEHARPECTGAVLVIDDEPSVGSALEQMLRAHDVTVVTSAQDALALLDAGREFDVILCDLMMPGMTGMQFYERLERTSPGVVERVIFMTGGTFTAAGTTFLQRVPNLCIDKPFDLRALRALVKSRIRAGCTA